MKPFIFAAAAMFALAACGQTEPTPAAAPAAPTPQGLMAQIQAQSPENQPVTAWQELIKHPETMPVCHEVRRAERRGIVPADAVAPYAGHTGELVFSIQCGPQLTTVSSDPHAHWLVFFAPGATTSTLANCADSAGHDQCLPSHIPTAATPAPSTP
jgi:hypothetical protein